MKTMREKAMLVRYQDSVWIATKLDKKVTEDVAKRAEAKSSAVGRYHKRLVTKAALEQKDNF